MAYEIYTYGGGETLWYVFNAVVTMMSGSNYITLIKIAGISALFWVIAQGIFKGGTTSLTFLLVYIIVYGVMFVPKVNVVIVDRVVGDYSGRVVANVPWGLGFFAHMTSKIGDSITRTTESSFALPRSAKYTENGMLFNSYIIEAASQWVITDETFSSNMQEFMKQCVFYDILLRKYTWQQLTTSKNIWEFVGSNSPSPVRGLLYATVSPIEQNFVSCQIAYATLSNAWKKEIKNSNEVYGQRLYPHLNLVNAVSRMLADTPAAYSYLMKYSSEGANIVRQNLMINVTKRAIRNTATGANATASVTDFAQIQAEATLKVNQDTAGRMAAKILPLTKNILEAVIYATFPFVLLMMLLPVGGSVFMTYITTLLWIQMWAPLYAILNLFMELYAEDRMTAVSNIGNATGTGPSIATNTGILSVASDTASIAGYLSMSIPVIAWMLVSGGKFAASQVASAVVGAAGGAASQAAPGAASGNIKLGELGAYNTSMFQNKTSPINDSMQGTLHQANGQVSSFQSGGQVKTNDLIPNRTISFSQKTGLTRQHTLDVKQATQQKNEAESRYIDSVNSAFTSTNAFGNSHRSSRDFGRNTGIDKNSTRSRYSQNVKDMTKILSNTMSQTDAETTSRKITMMLGVGGKSGKGLRSLRGVVLRAALGVEAGANIQWDKGTQNTKQKNIQRAISRGIKNNVGKEWRISTGYTDKGEFKKGWAISEESADDTRAALANIRQASKSHVKSISKLNSVTDSYTKAKSQGAEATHDRTKEVYDNMAQRGIYLGPELPKAKTEMLKNLLVKHDFDYDKVAKEYKSNSNSPVSAEGGSGSEVGPEVDRKLNTVTHANVGKKGEKIVKDHAHESGLKSKLDGKEKSNRVYEMGESTREIVEKKEITGEELRNGARVENEKMDAKIKRDNEKSSEKYNREDQNIDYKLHHGVTARDPKLLKIPIDPEPNPQPGQAYKVRPAKPIAPKSGQQGGPESSKVMEGKSRQEVERRVFSSDNNSTDVDNNSASRSNVKISVNQTLNAPDFKPITGRAPGSPEVLEIGKRDDYSSTQTMGRNLQKEINAVKASLNKPKKQ
ncbi:hypothetical protein MNBD_GAMMA12-3112 [hydrothermal vent metagenome]|uniref:TraG N-terminal Proteobacteria domain-containing protein n=1 Tax=hydrothermal vent metagenome TaxID=652676 RepID=A0A3B0YUA5_9ZZZZ